MQEAILSDYFYGDEAEQFTYFRIPRQLTLKVEPMQKDGQNRVPPQKRPSR